MKPWWRRLAPYARPHWRGLTGISLLMLLGVGLDVLKPWPTKILVDHVLLNQNVAHPPSWIATLLAEHSPSALIAILAAATVVLFLGGQIVAVAQGYLAAGVGNRMIYDLGAELFDHLQRLSMRFHGRRPAGDLVRRVTSESGCLRDLVLSVCFPIITSVVSLAAMLGVLWRMDRFLSLIALLAVPPLALLVRLFAGPMQRRTLRQMELQGEMASLAEQTLTALPVVQSFCREQYETERFRTLSTQTVKASLHAITAQLQFKYGTTSVTALGTAAVMLLGGLHVLQGSVSVGGLLVFFAYLASLYAPLESLAMLSSGFASAAAGARRVLEVFDADEVVLDLPGAKPLPPCREGHGRLVRFENVTFGYVSSRPVLHGIHLEARPGETLALVGRTGAGKTTLVSLIARFFDVGEGCVTVDGVDVRQIQLASLRAQVAVVLQDPFLLPISVADNIGYGRPHATRVEIEAAAAAANAAEFIERLPLGYDTVIGERGATLSGGEKQRLAIARALLKDAPILILDEPTSSLDAQTETLVMEAVERLKQGRTTFVIAHRLSTIRRADRIVVLEGGHIVEEGGHADLLGAGGHYSRLHGLQFTPHAVRTGVGAV